MSFEIYVRRALDGCDDPGGELRLGRARLLDHVMRQPAPRPARLADRRLAWASAVAAAGALATAAILSLCLPRAFPAGDRRGPAKCSCLEGPAGGRP
jgi:hypothetical protein